MVVGNGMKIHRLVSIIYLDLSRSTVLGRPLIYVGYNTADWDLNSRQNKFTIMTDVPGSFAKSRSTFSSSSSESSWLMLVSTFTLLVELLYPAESGGMSKWEAPPVDELEYSYLAVLNVRRPDVGLTDLSRMILVVLLGEEKYCTSRLLFKVEKFDDEFMPRELPGRDTDCCRSSRR